MKLNLTIFFTIGLVISAIFIFPINSWAFNAKTHTDVTYNGLSFLREEVKKEITDRNLGQDSNTAALKAENHFDACAFREASYNIQGKYNSALSQTSNNHPLDAAGMFGRLLHPIQDFYSHSNWAEISRSRWASTDKVGIVDNSLGMWKTINSWQVLKGKVVPIQVSSTVPGLDQAQPPKSGWTVQKITPQPGYFSDPLPEVKDPKGNEYVGLITHGRESYRLGDDCPDAVEGWNHGQLNKDGPERSSYVGQSYIENRQKAFSLAVEQTTHEWCRYLSLLKSNPKYGFPAVSIPMALWVDPKANLADKEKSPLKGTACQPSETGHKSLIVSISNIKIINDLDQDRNPGDLKLAFVLYTGDLKRSVRTETSITEVESGNNWPPSKLPQPLTMCLKSSDTLVATVQGWDDENSKTNPYYGKFNSNVYGEYLGEPTIIADSDQTLRGITFNAAGPGFGQGTQKVGSANIEVTLQISMMPYCIPEGITSQSTDIDKDGLVDSQDNCKSIPNQDQKDTDKDRVGDLCDKDQMDTDKDGLVDSKDNCALISNPDQKDTNNNGVGDVCESGDIDHDGIVDLKDNCKWVANPDQKDEDNNGVGDACKDVIL